MGDKVSLSFPFSVLLREQAVERISLDVGVTHRHYLLSGGSTASAKPVPLVVFLHGTGATADWADHETGWSRVAEREGFALAIPEALPPDPTTPPKFLTNPPHWNDGTDEKAYSDSPTVLHNTSDVTFLTAVIDDATRRAGVDSRRVFVSGFSNGAAMTFRLAVELSNRIAAIAPVAGHCWIPEPRSARPIPTLYVVGSADPLIPLRGGEARSPWQHHFVHLPPVVETLEKWARTIGCEPVPRKEERLGLPSSRYLFERFPALAKDSVRVDTYPGPVLFRSVVIDGLGHHWPGGKGGFNHRIAGPQVDTVNGTELVWDFFTHHAL
jgi:polyhydroxybutyrate depolymerase